MVAAPTGKHSFQEAICATFGRLRAKLAEPTGSHLPKDIECTQTRFLDSFDWVRAQGSIGEYFALAARGLRRRRVVKQAAR